MREPLLNRVTSRLSNWFPVVLLGVLAALTYWLDAQVHSGENTGETPTHVVFVELKEPA